MRWWQRVRINLHLVPFDIVGLSALIVITLVAICLIGYGITHWR